MMAFGVPPAANKPDQPSMAVDLTLTNGIYSKPTRPPFDYRTTRGRDDARAAASKRS